MHNILNYSIEHCGVCCLCLSLYRIQSIFHVTLYMEVARCQSCDVLLQYIIGKDCFYGNLTTRVVFNFDAFCIYIHEYCFC